MYARDTPCVVCESVRLFATINCVHFEQFQHLIYKYICIKYAGQVAAQFNRFPLAQFIFIISSGGDQISENQRK